MVKKKQKYLLFCWQFILLSFCCMFSHSVQIFDTFGTVKLVYSTNLSSSSFSLLFFCILFPSEPRRRPSPWTLRSTAVWAAVRICPRSARPSTLNDLCDPSSSPPSSPPHLLSMLKHPLQVSAMFFFLISSHSGIHDLLNAFNISLSYSNLFWHLLIWFSGYVLFLGCHSALSYVKRSGALCM